MNINEIPEALCQHLRLKIISSLLISPKSFHDLIESTGATKGNLSVQLSKLEEWGYLKSLKKFENKKPKTTYTLTEMGINEFEEYVLMLESVLLNNGKRKTECNDDIEKNLINYYEI